MSCARSHVDAETRRAYLLAMLKNRSVPVDTVLPHVTYRNLAQAIDWLTATFGFVEYYRYGDPVQGAQLHIGNAFIMVNSARSGRSSPAELGSETQSLTIFIEDVEAHYARTRAAARIVEPTSRNRVRGIPIWGFGPRRPSLALRPSCTRREPGCLGRNHHQPGWNERARIGEIPIPRGIQWTARMGSRSYRLGAGVTGGAAGAVSDAGVAAGSAAGAARCSEFPNVEDEGVYVVVLGAPFILGRHLSLALADRVEKCLVRHR